MEDSAPKRKRSLALDSQSELNEDEDGVAANVKRLAVGTADENIPRLDLMNEEHLDQFKKNAIWREFQVCKSQLARIETDLLESNKLKSQFETAFSVINRHWIQLDSDLELLVRRIAPSVDQKLHIRSSFIRHLLESASVLHSQSDETPLVHEVESRSNFTKETVAGILQLIEEISESQKLLSESLKSNDKSAVSQNLTLENDRLDALNASLLVTIDKVQIDYRKIVADNVELKDNVALFKERVAELESSLADTQDTLIQVERSLIRERSSFVQRYTAQANVDANAVSADGTAAVTTLESPTLEVMTSRAVDDKKNVIEMEELKTKLEHSTKLAEDRLKQLTELQHEKSVLRHELDKAAIDLKILPETVIVESPVFKSLSVALDNSRKEVLFQKSKQEALVKELELLNSERSSFISQTLDEAKLRQTQLETELKSVNADLFRVRGLRDQLQAKVDVINQAKSKPEEKIKSLKDSVSRQRTHIDCLLKDIHRLKLKIASSTGEAGFFKNVLYACELESSGAKASPDAVETLKTFAESLQDQIEKQRIQLSALKGPADVASAHVEMETCKQELARYRQLSESPETADLTRALEAKESELVTLRLRLQAFEKSEEAALQEIESIADLYTKTEAVRKSCEETLESKDEAIAKLFLEKSKVEQKMLAFGKDRENLGAKIKAMEANYKSMQDKMHVFEEKETAMRETLNEYERYIAQLRSLISVHEERVRELSHHSEVLSAKLEKQSGKYSDVSRILQDKESEIEKLTNTLRTAEEDASKLNSKIRHINKRVQSNLFSENSLGTPNAAVDAAEIENLRGWKKIAQCTVCEFRIKNHVITKCMHVFCKECIDARLETRQRKCPLCGGMFGPGDVKQIFI